MMINKITKFKSIFSLTKFPGGSPYLKQYFTDNPIKLVPQLIKENQKVDNLYNSAINIQSQNERVLPHIAPISNQSQPDLFLQQSKTQYITTSSKQFYYKHANIQKYFSTTKCDLIIGQPTPIINYGDDFKQLITKSTVFVDKSLFVKEIINSKNEVTLITMPRRWGKSLNFDMLKRFLEINVDEESNPVKDKTKTDNYKLFAGGKIYVDDQGEIKEKVLSELKLIKENPHILETQGCYPVIYVDFKHCKNQNYSNILREVKIAIIEAYDRHDYLLTSGKRINKKITINEKYTNILEEIKSGDIDAIKYGLKNLSQLLSLQFNKRVWILIDEYDAAANKAYMEFKDVEEAKEVSELFKDIFERALKGNLYLEKGVMTGVLNILQSGMLSGLNNVSKHNFTSQMYAKYYGINNEEMNHLLRAFSIGEKQKSQIKDWYNGYREYLDEKNFQDKYNIWSVVNYLTKQGHGFISYWEESGLFEFIAPFFKYQTFKEKIESLIYGETIILGDIYYNFTVDDLLGLQKLTRIENSEIDSDGYDQIFSYLYITGYLTIERGTELRIPNKELRKVFGSRIKKFYKTIFKIDFNKLERLTKILEKILTLKSKKEILKSLEEFREGLEHILEGINLIKKNEEKQNGLMANEDLFHSLINMIAMQVVDSKFGTVINTELANSEGGRADILIIKENSGIIFEIKYNRNSKTALAQVKKYSKLIENCENRVFIGCYIANDKTVTIYPDIEFGKSAKSQ